MNPPTQPPVAPVHPAEKARLLVMASTYPRWPNDPEPAFVHELARRLCRDFDVYLLAPHSHGAQCDELLDGVRVHRFRYAPARWQRLVSDGGIISNLRKRPWTALLVPGFLIALLWSTWRAVRRVRPQVIHAHWLIPQGLAVALLSLVQRMPPVLVTSHGADLFALRGWPFALLKRLVCRRAAALTVVSPVMVDELAQLGVPAEKTSVLPMGVDMQSRFTPNAGTPRSASELLFVGRLVEKKGVRHLIEALPAVLHRHPAAHLTIAGFGPDQPALVRQVAAIGLEHKVSFLGPVPQNQLADLYRRAALFVAPFVRAADGDQEGLGLVTLEAIACGCPAIVGDVPATRALDVLRVAPGNAQALATRIADYLDMPADARAALATRQRASVQAFDWQHVASGYASLLERLSNPHQRSTGEH
ncbi:MAG: glycosyltransferase [Xanthomonadaceae bacterium]|nr:glycosyltransferase [Xanthomonadaceae bacterium]